MCYWKQWRPPRTNIRNLVRLGVNLDMAIKTRSVARAIGVCHRHRPCATRCPTIGWSNRDLFRSHNSGVTVLRFAEPPAAEPHIRWCGEGCQRWRPLPDFGVHSSHCNGSYLVLNRGSKHNGVEGPGAWADPIPCWNAKKSSGSERRLISSKRV